MKSFLSGRPSAAVPSLKPLLDKPPVHPGVGASTPAASSGHRSASQPGSSSSAPFDRHAHEPSVECVKQGDKVTHLIVTCACGERIEIDCLYAGPA